MPDRVYDGVFLHEMYVVLDISSETKDVPACQDVTLWALSDANNGLVIESDSDCHSFLQYDAHHLPNIPRQQS